MDVRKEDLGKMMLKDAPILDNKIILDTLTEYFGVTKNAVYLLYGRGLNYFTIFRNQSILPGDSAKNFVEFTDDSTFYILKNDETEIADLEAHNMNEILEIEYNKDINAVELWIGQGNPQYFQLMAWDGSTVII